MSAREGRRLVLDALDEVFPWTCFLSDRGRERFASDLVDTARACADMGVWAPLGQLLHEWKATAAVRADPDLHAALTASLPEDDHGPVPAPAGTSTNSTRPESDSIA